MIRAAQLASNPFRGPESPDLFRGTYLYLEHRGNPLVPRFRSSNFFLYLAMSNVESQSSGLIVARKKYCCRIMIICTRQQGTKIAISEETGNETKIQVPR